MLYMVVATHGPDTCAAFVEEPKKRFLAMKTQIDDVAKTHGVTVKGSWVAMVAHTIYLIVDAPNGHAVQDFVAGVELYAWNTVVMYPVNDLGEILQNIK